MRGRSSIAEFGRSPKIQPKVNYSGGGEYFCWNKMSTPYIDCSGSPSRDGTSFQTSYVDYDYRIIKVIYK